MAIVTLTSDLGLKDYYVAVLKGKILSGSPAANIVDITHEIKPFDIQEAAFILKNAFPYFPDNTIHLVSVFAENKAALKCVVIEYHKQFFAGVDNGLFSLVFDEHPTKIIEIPRDVQATSTFVVKDVLTDVICKMVKGEKIEDIGKVITAIEAKTYLRPPDNAFIMKGSVVYIDRFGNSIINISAERFEKIRMGRNFKINYHRNDEFSDIKKTYSDVADGERLCLFNSAGHLEIAINKGSATELLGLHLDDVIQIEFD